MRGRVARARVVGVVSVAVRLAAVARPPSSLRKDKELPTVSGGGRRNAKQRRDTPARAATSGFADPVLVLVMRLEKKGCRWRWRHVQQSCQANWTGVRVCSGSEAPSPGCYFEQTPLLICASTAWICADIAAVFCWIHVGVQARSVGCSTTKPSCGVVIDPALGSHWICSRSAGKER